MRRILFLVAFATVLFPFACQDVKEEEKPQVRYLTYKTTDYKGDMIHEWVQLGYLMAKENFFFGPHAARTYGYIGFTAWESVYGGIPGAKSLAGQVNDYPVAAKIDESKAYDWGIVLCTAMKTVFPELIENIKTSQRGAVNLLADVQENEMMALGVTEEIRSDSRALGLEVGARIVKRMKSDGRNAIKNINVVLPARDAAHKFYWDPATFNQSPTEPNWGTLRTFVVDNSQSCEIAPPFAYSETPGTEFYNEAKEVYDYPRTAANKAIAYHWENGPGRTCSPACHWVNITEQLLKSQDRDLAFSAKAYALVGFAASDAFGVAWYLKYKFNLMRPATYLREQFDPSWNGLVGTPPYPDYTSGSSTIGGAAPVVLSNLFGNIAFVDKTHLGSPLYTPDGGPFILPERSFQSLVQAGEEQAESRIIGGVHFRRACTLGLDSGRCIGNTITSRLDFGY
jgi:hypothetical protein